MPNLQPAITSPDSSFLVLCVRAMSFNSGLRDLIRAVRSCRTAQDERDLISKECALIRNAFKKGIARATNVSKLLYIHVMGYPAHFGQMECLKLIASSKFSDKRIGYLGAMMLLDEKQDVHLLITNSMKNDMNHNVQYVVGLSLCTLGSICSEQMCQDLCPEVERLLNSTNPYIVRKAALCAVRIVQKVPYCKEVFIPITRSLLKQKNHSVILSGVYLVTAICQSSPDSLHYFRRYVPNLVCMLKNLVIPASSSEHDVYGINDPFLQVRILRLLRILGKGDADCSDMMNDILAQVATNTQPGTDVGHGILYETALTITEIQAESGLHVLAINILGHFLKHFNRNVCYVALNTLLKTLSVDHFAVQRHRLTILSCLKEDDDSIQRRALELSFALVNSSNIRSTINEILAFLERADAEFKSYICTHVIRVVENYATNQRWHIDTVLDMVIKAGSHVPEELVSGIIDMISEAEDLHAHCCRKLFVALTTKINHQPLTQVGVWCIGEYGDFLISAGVDEDIATQVNENDVIKLLERTLQSPQSTWVTRNYAINALMKLSTRFTSSVAHIKSIVSCYSDNLNMELQQRAVEYGTIFNKYDRMRPGLFERIPPLHTSSAKVDDDSESKGETVAPKLDQPEIPVHQLSQQPSLLDLLDSSTDATPLSSSSTEIGTLLDLIDFSGEPVAPKLAKGELPVQQPSQQPSLLNLLDSTHEATPSPSSAATKSGALLDLIDFPSQPNPTPLSTSLTSHERDDLHKGDLIKFLGAPTQHPVPSAQGIPSITALERKGLLVKFHFKQDPVCATGHFITLTATNSTSLPFTDFIFQAAVPKAFQLQMLPPSSNIIPAHLAGSVCQVVKVNNPHKQPLRMRIRLSYRVNGTPVSEQTEVSHFPPELMK